MRTLTTLLAIFAFGLHLLLGCCWHHAHGADELHGHQHDAVGHHVHLPKCCSHSHSHGSENEHSQSEDAPAPHAPCSDPQCVYLVSSPLQVDAAQDVVLPLAPVDLQLQSAEFRTSIHNLAEHEKNPPHLRRHLALSRLLN
jgi:hypothetical protein